MTSGKGSRTARKGCGLRTFGQQVQSQYRSRPREGSVAATPLAALPSPNRIASPRPRFGPGEAARPCGRNLPARSLPRASRRRQALRFLGAAARPGLLPPPRVAAVPQPGASRGPAHLHLFAEVARPRHCQRPGAAAAAMPVAPASRPRHGPGAGSRVAFRQSVSRSCFPTLPQLHRAGCS